MKRRLFSGAIEAKTKAISIDIDITNVEVLKIKLTDKIGEGVVWLHNTLICRELTESDIELAIQ